MDDKMFKSLMNGVNEAVDHTRGKKASGMIEHHIRIPDSVDVKAVRAKMEMTQKAFSETFGFTLDSVKSWEQGRREPDRSARILLKVIDTNPAAVFQALQ